MRIVEWNITDSDNVALQLERMDELGWDVALLHNVHPRYFDDFGLHRSVWGAEYGLNQEPERIDDGAVYSAAILCRGNVELITTATMANVPFPERTLIGLIQLDGAVIEVASLSVPPELDATRVSNAQQVSRFADRFAGRSFPTLAGIDRNSPISPPQDMERTAWISEAEKRAFGVMRKHDLKNVDSLYVSPDLDLVEVRNIYGMMWARVQLHDCTTVTQS